MKKIATLLFSLALISVAANADDKPVDFQQLPSSAKTFIKSEFPLESILFITKDSDLLDTPTAYICKHPINDVYQDCYGVATFASNTKSHDDKGRGRSGDCLLRREQDQLQTAPVGTWN